MSADRLTDSEFVGITDHQKQLDLDAALSARVTAEVPCSKASWLGVGLGFVYWPLTSHFPAIRKGSELPRASSLLSLVFP